MKSCDCIQDFIQYFADHLYISVWTQKETVQLDKAMYDIIHSSVREPSLMVNSLHWNVLNSFLCLQISSKL